MTVTALSIALAAGVLSFLSPCIVPMLSVYFTMITGESFRSLRDMSAAEAIRKGVLRNTLAFVAGFSLVFTAAGAVAAQVGALLPSWTGLLNVVGGLFVISLGLVTMDVLPSGWVQRLALRHRDLGEAPAPRRAWSSFLVGIFFAVACSHCIAPTLYSVLIFAGGTGSAMTGAALMAAFSLGLSIPYILAGVFLGRTVSILRQATKARVWAPRVAGLLMIGLGLLMVSGKLTLLTAAISRLLPYKLPIGM